MKILFLKGNSSKKQEELAQMYEESRILAQELGLHPYYMYRQKKYGWKYGELRLF